MQHIKFVYFDVGSVLIDWQDVFSTAAKRCNLEIEDIGSVFDQNCTDITLGRMSAAQFWDEVTKKHEIDNAKSYDFLTSWVSDYKPISPTHSLIHQIKSMYKIGLLSNIYLGMLPLLLDKELIPNIEYQSIVFSCDVGLMKPEPEIYVLAQQQANVNASEILLVDDKQENLDAAEVAGWQTFLFDPFNPEKSIQELTSLLKHRS